MENKKRKVSFYSLSLERETFISERHYTQIDQLSPEEIEEQFNKIYNNMKMLENKRKAVNIKTPSNDYVIEIIEYNEHLVFAKIGQQNSANTVALRDQNTLESQNVPMTATQLLELYTYFLIDFKSTIISYIGINGAPKISAIRALFDTFLSNDENISAKLAAILTDDIVQTIKKKQIISKLSLTVAVPSDEKLSGIIGLSAKDFDSLRNVKTRTATYKLVSTRNKNIFQSSGKIAELIASIKNKFGDNLIGLTVNAKDDNESSQPYNLLQYSFTKTVTLKGEGHSNLLEDDFKKVLKETYASNKVELLRYI